MRDHQAMWDARIDSTAELRRRVAEDRYEVDADAVARSILSRLMAARHGALGGGAALLAALERSAPLPEH